MTATLPLCLMIDAGTVRQRPANRAYSAARYRKVTACARVTAVSGSKAVSDAPVVMPFATAQATASA